MLKPSPDFLLVDAHVHVHPGFARDAFLDGALRNFHAAVADLELEGTCLGCLLLAEMGPARWFRQAREGRVGSGTWSFERTGEAESLRARRDSGEELLVIAGRQIATREGLEVLALAGEVDVPDGLPFGEALLRTRASGALPVVPWGFGKWWGRRGRLVEGALTRRGSAPLFLGDNGCRPELGGEPRLFRQARERGIAVLPGSDPLPFPSHAGRAGSYGFILEGGGLGDERPAETLRKRVRQLGDQPRVFGHRTPLPRFVRDQVDLRRRKRSEATA